MINSPLARLQVRDELRQYQAYYTMLMAGAIPAAALELLVQFGFDLLDRWLISAHYAKPAFHMVERDPGCVRYGGVGN